MVECAVYVVDAALLCHAHPVFDLGEGLFDGIQVGRIRRQKPKPCSCISDHPANGLALMAAKIVENDDVTFPERRDELLLDISAETQAVDRPVEDAWSSQAIAPQGGKEGQGPPSTVRCVSPQSLALRPPSAQRSHIGLDPGLVDEHETAGIEAILPCLPAFTPAFYVRTPLLKSEQSFF